jgi:hypothetical protein
MPHHAERTIHKTYEAVSSVEHQKQPAVFQGSLRRFQGLKHVALGARLILHPKSNVSPDLCHKIAITLIMPREAVLSVIACSRQFDCGLSISTRWIGSVTADFVFAFLSCVLVCESSA